MTSQFRAVHSVPLKIMPIPAGAIAVARFAEGQKFHYLFQQFEIQRLDRENPLIQRQIADLLSTCPVINAEHKNNFVEVHRRLDSHQCFYVPIDDFRKAAPLITQKLRPQMLLPSGQHYVPNL